MICKCIRLRQNLDLHWRQSFIFMTFLTILDTLLYSIPEEVTNWLWKLHQMLFNCWDILLLIICKYHYGADLYINLISVPTEKLSSHLCTFSIIHTLTTKQLYYYETISKKWGDGDGETYTGSTGISVPRRNEGLR